MSHKQIAAFCMAIGTVCHVHCFLRGCLQAWPSLTYTLICIQMGGRCSANSMAQVGIFFKILIFISVCLYVDIKEAYNTWLITHLWLPCLLPKSISGYFSISESISPHPVLFMELLKKRNIYIGIFFLFCFEIQRLIDSYLNHISLWVPPPPFCLFLREQNFQVL